MTRSPTPTWRLADHILGEPLADRVARDRTAGKAWRIISRELYTDTAGQVDVTHETLRTWFPDANRARAS